MRAQRSGASAGSSIQGLATHPAHEQPFGRRRRPASRSAPDRAMTASTSPACTHNDPRWMAWMHASANNRRAKSPAAAFNAADARGAIRGGRNSSIILMMSEASRRARGCEPRRTPQHPTSMALNARGGKAGPSRACASRMSTSPCASSASSAASHRSSILALSESESAIESLRMLCFNKTRLFREVSSALGWFWPTMLSPRPPGQPPRRRPPPSEVGR